MEEKNSKEPWQELLEKFLKSFPEGPISHESVDLMGSLNRTLAIEVYGRIDNPPFTQALMEGYLVHTADIAQSSPESPVSLEVIGKMEPGTSEMPALPTGSCLEVFTGSLIVIPAGGSLAVAPARDTVREGNRALIKKPLSPAENIELKGKEMKAPDAVLENGVFMTPKEIGILAGQGLLDTEVSKRPVVGIFSCGNEILPPTEYLTPGSLWDANSYILSALVINAGGEPKSYGIMRDEMEPFRKAAEEALTTCDMLLVSGGTFAGGRNFISELVQSLGAPGVIVDGVPMRSGRPIILGLVNKKPIVCVAGYSPEAIRGFDLFGKPTLARLLGRQE